MCIQLFVIVAFVFFKQKTAYEMRISDWSSDVCSSDLRLQHLRKSELDAEIASLGAKIDGLHRQLAANDRETEQIGRTALSKLELDGQRIEPLDAAREVLAAGEEATWLPDAIGPATDFEPRFNDEDIAALRTARQAVGDDLCYLGKPLPPADFLADVDSILAAHERLQ